MSRDPLSLSYLDQVAAALTREVTRIVDTRGDTHERQLFADLATRVTATKNQVIARRDQLEKLQRGGV